MASEPVYTLHPDMITLRQAEALVGINYQNIHKAARRGHHDIDNIDFAHYGCNAQKQDRTPEEYREWRERVA